MGAASRIDSHEDAPGGTSRCCPKCNAKMWPSPVPKPCTFQKLRPTTATLLLALAQTSGPCRRCCATPTQVTTERYAHLVPGYLQEQITRLKLTGFASPLLPAAANNECPTEAPDRNDQVSREFELERETGFEPATLSLGKRIGRFVGACRHSQVVTRIGDSRSGELHSVSFGARFCSPFAAPVLQGFLSVRDVATQLSVSTATVYKLCASRELPHVRVLGAIRIAPDDLATFVERLRRASSVD